MLKLIPDWRRVTTKAWSVRLIAAVTLLSAVELVLQLTTPDKPSLWFTVATVVVSVLATVARLLQQKSMTDAQNGSTTKE